MAANKFRDTAGRLLFGWAVLMACLVILAWRIHWNRESYEWTEYPTALGDAAYYTTLGKDDRYEPNLLLPRHTSGLYRRSLDPLSFEDASMLKITQETSGRYQVYQRALDYGSTSASIYLKSGENRYVEFGARKLYPPYVPKAVPGIK